jgi:hypothetical protein
MKNPTREQANKESASKMYKEHAYVTDDGHCGTFQCRTAANLNRKKVKQNLIELEK